MQSKNGGYGAFDVDNTYYYLNEIPFADHGALLDPPTADVSARCAMLMARAGKEQGLYEKALERAIHYLRSEQEADGSWLAVGELTIFMALGLSCWGLNKLAFRLPILCSSKAVGYLKSVQRGDGGWGEDNYSFHDVSYSGKYHFSTTFQTAWAVLGLMAQVKPQPRSQGGYRLHYTYPAS